MKKIIWIFLNLMFFNSFVFAQNALTDLNNIKFNQNINNLYKDLILPSKGDLGSQIIWKSSHPEYLSHSGKILARLIDEPLKVTLTATIQESQKEYTKDFDIIIHDYEPYSNYLFVYFPANDNENIYYAISNDGYNFTPMNNGKRVIASDSVSLKKGLRDPHILRAPDGYFYMVNTDMKSAEGWSSNRGMVLMKSKDLINWNHSTVHFPEKYKGTHFEKVTRVWAPETIWDKDYINKDGTKGRLIIYFSILENGGIVNYDKVFYAYANDDFTDLIDTPTYFYDRGSATIDMDIVYNPNDELYHAFYKNEGEGGICKVTTKKLTTENGKEGTQWSSPTKTLQQTKEAVEGAGVFKLINQDLWILMYDCYVNGHYQFTSSQDLTQFDFVQNTETKGAFTPRHGTVIPITSKETSKLLKAFPTNEFEPKIIPIPDTIGKTSDGKILVGPCSKTKIIPYIKISENSWQESTEINVKKGESVTFGPHPWDGKIWSWNGPDGFNSTKREFSLNNLDGSKSGIYSVQYTNETGCISEEKIKLIVDDPDKPYVEPISDKDSIETDTSTTYIKRDLEIINNHNLVKSEYFSITGQVLIHKPTQQGIYIKKDSYKNGKFTFIKLIIK